MIYMDVAQEIEDLKVVETYLKEIEIIEKDVKDVNEKCKRVNCSALFDAISSTFKLLYDLILMCCRPKDKK